MKRIPIRFLELQLFAATLGIAYTLGVEPDEPPPHTCFLYHDGQPATLIPSADGLTVFDSALNVRWLADANCGNTLGRQLGIGGILPNGAMGFDAAIRLVDAMNGGNGHAPYLGHANWTLPTTPTFPCVDDTCTQKYGPAPHWNSFKYECENSALGSLYYRSLPTYYVDPPLRYPEPVVQARKLPTGPFSNFQPYLYWSFTSSGDNGYYTFSFNTGWAGSNIGEHHMYALPMIEGALDGVRYHETGIDGLLVSEDGQTVFDEDATVCENGRVFQGITWLANANLAATHKFGIQSSDPKTEPYVHPGGSMTRDTAWVWFDKLNHHDGTGWLGYNTWRLPPVIVDDTCESSHPELHEKKCFPGFDCKKSPLGRLYYRFLGLTKGTPVVPAQDKSELPFRNVQPYLYWSCGAYRTHDFCEVPAVRPSAEDMTFEWCFSFGNGFQGTTVADVDKDMNSLYVMVYFPQTPQEALTEAISRAFGSSPDVAVFLKLAANISSAAASSNKADTLRAFLDHVEAKRGNGLTQAQADELVALAGII